MIYTYAYTSSHTHIYKYTSTTHLHTYAYTLIVAHMYTYTYIHPHTHPHTLAHTYVHIHTHTSTPICACTHPHTRTHLHTYSYRHIPTAICTHIHPDVTRAHIHLSPSTCPHTTQIHRYVYRRPPPPGCALPRSPAPPVALPGPARGGGGSLEKRLAAALGPGRAAKARQRAAGASPEALPQQRALPRQRGLRRRCQAGRLRGGCCPGSLRARGGSRGPAAARAGPARSGDAGRPARRCRRRSSRRGRHLPPPRRGAAAAAGVRRKRGRSPAAWMDVFGFVRLAKLPG